jgi:hypothetical protein
LGFDRPIFDPLLAGLPHLIIARRAGPGREWLDTTVRYILRDASWQPRPDAQSMRMRLTEILFDPSLEWTVTDSPARLPRPG